MKRKLNAPPKPTTQERENLEKYIWMQDWHFDVTIKKKCTELSEYSIHWDKKETEWEKAQIFGLQAIKTSTKEPCIANFFIRYQYRVYQTSTLSEIPGLISLLKKEAAYEEYCDEVADQKRKEKEKLLRKKHTGKTHVRKMQIIAKKNAA